MASNITGICLLILTICQLSEARMVHRRPALDMRRNFQKWLNDISKDEMSISKFEGLMKPGSDEKHASLAKEREQIEKCVRGSQCGEEGNGYEHEKFRVKEQSENGGKNRIENDEAPKKFNAKKPYCPIGLWCINEQKRGYENSDTLDRCPPGLWCKRNRIKWAAKDLFTKQPKKRERERLCQSGHQCSVQRDEDDAMADALKRCPPGLWCKRNQEVTNVDKTSCPIGFKCSSKREAGFESYTSLQNCPPGLWCKRDEFLAKEGTAKAKGTTEECPDGLKCSDQRLMSPENLEILGECPPGFVCQGSFSSGDGLIKEQSNNPEEDNLHCSSGTWCAVKRDVSNIVHNNLERCPPGLWCKRNTEKIHRVASKQGDDNESWQSLQTQGLNLN